MKQFGQYSEAVRSKAIDSLADRGIHVWDADFDQNSERVLEACQAADLGYKIVNRKSESLYTWTPAMVSAYQNSPDGIPGERLSLDWAAAQACRDEGAWSFKRGEPLDAGGWSTASAKAKDHHHCAAMNRLHAEGYNTAARKVGRAL